MAQLMPLPLAVSFFSKIQIGFTFLILAHPVSTGQRQQGRKTDVCVLMCLMMAFYYSFIQIRFLYRNDRMHLHECTQYTKKYKNKIQS